MLYSNGKYSSTMDHLGQGKKLQGFYSNLVGGFNHLENYESQWEDDYPIYEMENKKCLKPPTSSGYPKKIDDNLET